MLQLIEQKQQIASINYTYIFQIFQMILELALCL